jgi:hypothetical protein
VGLGASGAAAEQKEGRTGGQHWKPLKLREDSFYGLIIPIPETRSAQVVQ